MAARAATVIAALMVASLLGGCRTAEDPARAALRARLKQDAKLTPAELRQLVAETGRAIEQKTLKIRTGAVVQAPDQDQRLEILAVLVDPGSAYEAEVRREGPAVLRGLTMNVTPALSEIDAMQTLWIDADTFIPRRYELTHSSAGFGDYAYDLLFE